VLPEVDLLAPLTIMNFSAPLIYTFVAVRT